MKLNRHTMMMIFALLGLFIALGCGGSGDDDPGSLVEQDDDAADDDVPGIDDDDDTADDDTADDDIVGIELECGAQLTESVVLAADMDCRDWAASPVVQFGAGGITLNCNGHLIQGPTDNHIPIIAATDYNGVRVINCEITGGAIGINARNGSNVKLKNNEIHEVINFGIWVDHLDQFEISGNVVYNDYADLAGIEIFNSTGGDISENEVSFFGRGGIQFYGSSDCALHNNTVHHIIDTCYGFFSDNDAQTITHDIEVYENEAYEVQNVGANEIMFGSHSLNFHDNNYHDCVSAFAIYEGSGEFMHDIVINNNEMTDNDSGIYVNNDAYGVEITNNTMTHVDFPLSFSNASDITITGNTFDYGSRQVLDTGYVINIVDIDGLSFQHNVILGYDLFAAGEDSDELDLSENYWNGCPDLFAFSFAEHEVLDLINPINSLQCFVVDRPINIVDGDGDGFDDNNCERSFDIECLDP